MEERSRKRQQRRPRSARAILLWLGTDSGLASLVFAAVALLAAGLVHVVAWCVYGGPIEVPVSWRKPILFCIASGVTCLSLAWVYLRCHRVSVDRPAAWALAVAILAEVALISMQQWRGVPSHFNSATDFDAWVLFGIKAFVAVVTLSIVYFCYRLLGPLHLTDDYAASARCGMVLLVIACVLGFVIEAQGESLARDGLSPTVYGKAGILKFPHGMPLHAIQYLPVTAWVLERLGATPRSRLISVWSMGLGIFGLTLFALMQSYAGRARFDLTFSSAALLAVSAALLLPSLASVVLAIARKHGDQ